MVTVSTIHVIFVDATEKWHLLRQWIREAYQDLLMYFIIIKHRHSTRQIQSICSNSTIPLFIFVAICAFESSLEICCLAQFRPLALDAVRPSWVHIWIRRSSMALLFPDVPETHPLRSAVSSKKNCPSFSCRSCLTNANGWMRYFGHSCHIYPPSSGRDGL